MSPMLRHTIPRSQLIEKPCSRFRNIKYPRLITSHVIYQEDDVAISLLWIKWKFCDGFWQFQLSRTTERSENLNMEMPKTFLKPIGFVVYVVWILIVATKRKRIAKVVGIDCWHGTWKTNNSVQVIFIRALAYVILAWKAVQKYPLVEINSWPYQITGLL